VPVFSVGSGASASRATPSSSPSRRPARVERRAFEVRALVRHAGSGRGPELRAEDEGRVVHREPLARLLDGETTPVRVTLRADETGPRRFRFALEAKPERRWS